MAEKKTLLVLEAQGKTDGEEIFLKNRIAVTRRFREFLELEQDLEIKLKSTRQDIKDLVKDFPELEKIQTAYGQWYENRCFAVKEGNVTVRLLGKGLADAKERRKASLEKKEKKKKKAKETKSRKRIKMDPEE